MGWRHSDGLAFLETIPAAQTAAEVCAEVARALRHFEMKWYFIGTAVPPGHPLLPAVKYHNWPSEALDAFVSSELFEHNPIPRINAISHKTVTLNEYWQGGAGFAPEPACAPLFDILGAYQMTQFLFIPIHGPRGPRGFGIISSSGHDPDPRTRGLLGLLCHSALMRLSEIENFAQRHTNSETSLTDREVDMLSALSQGMDDAAIAQAFNITVRTVRFHISNARHKLGARSRGEALILAAKGGFFPQ